jgi:hypothetical protein
MNIPDKKTDLEDNRNARSFLKTRIQTESAGFFNGLLNLFLLEVSSGCQSGIFHHFFITQSIHTNFSHLFPTSL